MAKRSSWDKNPTKAFDAFIVSLDFAETAKRLPADGQFKTISKQSVEIYTYMFRNFCNWLAEQGKAFSEVDRADLKRFIDRADEHGRVINSKIAYRYLRLLDRCYQHLELDPNPAREAILATGQAEFLRDDPTRALSEDQLRRFFDALPSAPARVRQLTPFDGWKRRRDRAMQVVIALAGLRVAEAIGLLLAEVGQQTDIEGGIDITITPSEKHQTSHEHVTTLPREGAVELQAWLRERAAMGIPGDFVFPANTEGRKMIKKTVYMQVRATFERAGIDLSRAGGRTLRNTFAQRKLAEGATPDQLKDTLGLALERSAADYQFARVKPDPDE
ncbi:site-specific integrase [Massilia sp. IC2-477]|uniref:tyrosine-type recombinase/integrase n=1 Tax=Massilia sp. IC2-477 TaxID=2887198 RepID=UPI001D1258DF|nr:site-specific integrase [Massilia sp. IC2-477]MCC2955613.1 site-specific integrase [Massilia sp. IC2-477]